MANPAEFEALGKYLFGFAQEMLAEANEFYPTAAFINQDGKLEAFAVYTGEHPDAGDLFDAHVEAFRRDATPRNYRATGICVDGRAVHPNGGEKTDAILLFLEHRSGSALTVIMQYRRILGGAYEFAETFAVRRPAEVFLTGGMA